MRRAIALLTFAALAVGTTALAQDGGGESAPVVRSNAVLHLQGDRPCTDGHGVTLRVTPPAGVTLGWLDVRIDGRRVVRLTGVGGGGGASVTVRLPRRSARISAAAETLDGQQLSRARRYRSCIRPRPTPSPPQPRRENPPVIVGGGEA